MPQQPLNHPEFSREPNHSRLQVDDSVCFPSHDQDKFPDTDSIRGVDARARQRTRSQRKRAHRLAKRNAKRAQAAALAGAAD